MYEVKSQMFYFLFALVVETDFAIIFILLTFDMIFLTFDIIYHLNCITKIDHIMLKKHEY